MTASLLGRIGWGLNRDQDGHRTYSIKWLVESATTDDPSIILSTPGLPGIGASWAFGSGSDTWAKCSSEMKVEPVYQKEPCRFWHIEQKFSTKAITRCQDDSIEDPLLEPPKIGGTFLKYTAPAEKDRNGKAIKSSSHELIKRDFDENRPSVRISMNFSTIDLELLAESIDNLNDDTLWGLSARKIKLSNAPWTRKIYGSCTYYFTIDYEFDINFRTFDPEVIDEGSKVLLGWAPGSRAEQLDPDAIDITTGEANYKNPKNFERYKDVNGENARALLDGKGRPLADAANPTIITIEKYDEMDLTILGIPTSLV